MHATLPVDGDLEQRLIVDRSDQDLGDSRTEDAIFSLASALPVLPDARGITTQSAQQFGFVFLRSEECRILPRKCGAAIHYRVGQRHDHLFQQIFAEPEHAGPLLRSALAPTVALLIDWSTLTRCRRTHHGRRGKRTICDLLFAVRLVGGHPLLLYIGLEHKSSSSRFDALQMQEQVTAILRTHRREHPKDPFLPPVLPVVVHADQQPWRSPLQVRELFDLANLPAALHHYLPSLEFVLDDIREAPPDQLRQRALSILGLCGLSTLQFLPPAAHDPAAFTAWIDEWRDVLQRASRFADETSNEELFAAVVEYVLDTCDLPRPLVHRVVDLQLTDDAMKKKFVSTLTQTRNEGKAEGRVEGRNEGRVEGRADLLLRQLLRRFGAEATKNVEPRIRAATTAEIDRFAEQVLDAKTIDDVFTTADRG